MPRAYIPKTVPKEFLEDVVRYIKLFYGDGKACDVYGLEHQETMCKKWHRHWMVWVRENVGRFD